MIPEGKKWMYSYVHENRANDYSFVMELKNKKQDVLKTGCAMRGVLPFFVL